MANMCLEVDWKFDKWGRSGVGFGWGRGWGLRDSVNDWMKVQLGKVFIPYGTTSQSFLVHFGAYCTQT